jgi:thymidine kinase
MNKNGSITLYLGCMFSGKTTELIRDYSRYNKIGKKILCINYEDDNRYGNDNFLYSHNITKIECIKLKKLSFLDHDYILNYDIILINEGQFFDDIVDFCKLYCDMYSKHIIISALDGDYLRKPFGKIYEIIPLADKITKLEAFCSKCCDGTPGIFTWRLTDETVQISINNDYIPVCRKHYLELSKDKI